MTAADAVQNAAFLNPEAGRLFAVDVRDALARPRLGLFGTATPDLQRLQAQLARSESNPPEITMHFATPSGREGWADVEVCENPAHAGGRIVCTYDVTEVLDLRRELEGRVSASDLPPEIAGTAGAARGPTAPAATGRWQEALRAAHSLHPLAAQVGARSRQRLALEAEALAAAQDQAGLQQLLPALRHACARACARLDGCQTDLLSFR